MSVKICITSGSKGGTGKTTFAEILAYVWKALGAPVALTKPFAKSVNNGMSVIDFPAFTLNDKRHLEALLRCNALVYVVDEDYQTLAAVELIHTLARKEVLGVVVNKIVRRPSKEFVKLYSKLGEVYIVRFDEEMAVHRAVGIPPYKIRSMATIDMAKAAVEIFREAGNIKTQKANGACAASCCHSAVKKSCY
ncbi:hypothetical protein [Pyrobaculum aerophilum]|uniref:hypothetical protein n=1 Tax=Pyrobaculum aerophilum TaxID=13773 RepID=UPI001D0507D0|nr:hypothetical protein [Pyrobaculum aerophilum]